MVAAVMASAGVIFICVQASERIMGMEGVGEEPGLKSVASTTARPTSIMSRARRVAGRAERVDGAGQQNGLDAGGLQRRMPRASVCSR